MTRKAILLSVAALVALAPACFAADPSIGTWQMNERVSRIPAGATKYLTVVCVALGDSIKVTMDGVAGDGARAHNEWVGKFDGKDYPVTGDPTSDMRSYKQRGDAAHLEVTIKKAGKVIASGAITVTLADGTYAATITTVGQKGKNVTTASLYKKQ